MQGNAPSELLQRGSLRVGLNLSNTATVTQDKQTGELRGVAADLSRALADVLQLPCESVLYPTAIELAQSAPTGNWDVAFLAIDPARSRHVCFTPAYMDVHNSYMVASGSPLKTNADVDQPGVRVVVNAGNATDLYLTRSLQFATLQRVGGEGTALEQLQTGEADVVASGRGLLIGHATKWPYSRVLDGWFLSVGHGIGVPWSRESTLPYLRAFVEEAKRSGRVQKMLDQQGVLGVGLARPASSPSC